jgi:hypothetical protein
MRLSEQQAAAHEEQSAVLHVTTFPMQDERMRLSEQLAAARQEQSAALHLTTFAYH